MRFPSVVRAGAVGVLTVFPLLLSGCSSDSSMSQDDIVERVAEAYREAPTFTFNWVSPSESGDLTTTGALQYDDQGEVAAMRIRTTDESGTVTEEYRLIDGTTYTASSEGRFTAMEDSEAEEILKAWDWARAAEAWGEPVSMSEKGTKEIDGVETTGYEVVFEDDSEEVTQTWWIDDQDRLLRWEGEGENAPVGTLTDFGEDVEITLPSDLIDE